MEKEYLGQYVKDTVTGLEGYATGVIEWQNGCVQYIVTERGKNIFGNEILHKWYKKQIVPNDTYAKLCKSEDKSGFIRGRFQLGKVLTDEFTGFSGRAVARMISIFSDECYLLQPLPSESHCLRRREWFDVSSLKDGSKTDK